MATNIQAENATRLMHRNSVSSLVMPVNSPSVTDRSPTVVHYLDFGTSTSYGQLHLWNAGSGFYRFEVPNNSNISIGRLRATGYATYSSRRWKNSIQVIADGLNTILRLRPSEFNWNEEQGGEHDSGFIAEEIAEVLPHAAMKDADGEYGGIDLTRIIPYLASAIQQQQAQIEALTKQIQLLSSNTEGL